jgi:uncharacterized membrane protein
MGHFSEEDQALIIHAITLAENKTSGEIRLAVESRCKSTALERAAYYFHRLGMQNTALRNGVLIYIAVDDHQFAIIGDQGIDRKVPPQFWENTKDLMAHHFRQGNIVQGLIVGIENAGEQLSQYFPSAPDDINELPNDILFGND